MDDIYEYENSEYRLVSIQLKAIAYDIVTGIAKKKISLKKSGVNETEIIAEKLTKINDKIIELADLLEEEFQKLDQIEEKIEVLTAEEKDSSIKNNIVSKKTATDDMKTVEKVESKEITTIKKEENIENNEEPIQIEISKPSVQASTEENKELPHPQIVNNPENNQFVIPISAFKNNDINKKSEKIEEASEKSLPDISIKNEEKPVSVEVKPKEEITFTSVEEQKEPVIIKEHIKAKKSFQKQTKNLSKAIMVRPNQLENLRKSRAYQEQLLIKQGLFPEEDMKEEENPFDIETKELPENIERQIEDLTVKANIYYNEGEADKAQELYDKIKELNKEYR